MAYPLGGGYLGYHLGILYGKPTILPTQLHSSLRKGLGVEVHETHLGNGESLVWMEYIGI